MKSDSTTVIKNMEFLVKELHKEWDRSGQHKAVLGRCHAFRTWISDGKGVAFSLLFSLQKPGKPCCTRRFQH